MRASDESRDRVVERAARGRGQLADHPSPDDQVHARWSARPVRGAARAAGGRLARPDAAEQPVADLLERWPQRPRPGPHLQAAAPDARPGEHPGQGRGRHHRLGVPHHARGPAAEPGHRRGRHPEPARGEGEGRRHPHPARREHHRVAEAARLGLQRHRRVLQDLHPRRVSGRALRAAHAPPALPVPPVDLRRHAGLQGDLRPGQACRCRSCRSPSTTRATSSPPLRSRKRSDRASGSVAADEHRHHRTSRRRPARGRHHRRGTARRARPSTSAASPAGSTTAPARPSRSAT